MADSQQQQQEQYQQQHEGRHWMQDQEYYAEDTFGGVHATGRVYTGPFLGLSFMSIIGCFIMSSVVKKSPNLSFIWLQRRVGAQFLTFAYFFTTNILYYHDGRRWRTRDIDKLYKRAVGPIQMQWERRRRAKEATEKITGGLNPTSSS